MPKSKGVVDTNVLLRFILDDNARQSNSAQALFKNESPSKLTVPDAVVLEFSFVLLSFYKITKPQLIEQLKALITFESFEIDTDLWANTLTLYNMHSISLLDSYLLATSQKEDLPLYTFDKKLLALKEISTRRP